MNKILVIGGRGNIGSALVERLAGSGEDVTSMSKGASVRRELPSGIRQVAIDRGDLDAMRKFAEAEKFDVVYDLAAFTRAHVEQDFELFRDCRQIIITSSVGVYGIAPYARLPLTEDAPLAPIREYGAQKVLMEQYCVAMNQLHGWPVTIMRPASTYGRQKAIFRQIGHENHWIARIMAGKPIATGNDELLRNFMHIDDAARGLELTMHHYKSTIGQVYNLVGDSVNSWGEWHSAVMKSLGKFVENVEVPLKVLEAVNCPTLEMYRDSWRYNGVYCANKFKRDVPSFFEQVSLDDAVRSQLDYIFEYSGPIVECDSNWEDRAIELQQHAMRG